MLENSVRRAQYAASLLSFVRDAWEILEPERPFVENWHITELCKVLEAITEGRIRRAIINVPPGTMKSLLVSVFWPAWVWARNPKYRVLTAAYGSHLTIRDNLRVRDIIQSPWYQEFFPLSLVEDQNTKTRFNTSAGGWRIATSVGGVGTGEHPDLIIIDDALTAQQADSEPERTAANNWFDRTISSRGVSRDVCIVVIGQRLHEEDLPGYLLKKDRAGWHLVCWPMRYEKCTCLPDALPDQRCPMHKADPDWRKDDRDPRTEPGQLLMPKLFDEKKVKQLELDLGPYGSAGQLQQRPSPEGGGLFKREWFKFVDVAPAFGRRVRGWDTAGTEDDGDYTVGARVSEEFELKVENGRRETVTTGRVFVEDVQRDQLGPAGVDRLMRVTAELDGRDVPVREEKEGGASGNAVVASRATTLKGFDYTFIVLGTNKVVRAKAFRSQVEAGNVYLVRGAWNEEFIKELCAFPTAKHDDQVDAVSCAYNALVLEPPPKKHEATW